MEELEKMELNEEVKEEKTEVCNAIEEYEDNDCQNDCYEPQESGLKKAAKIGLGIFAGVGIGALARVGYLKLREKKERRIAQYLYELHQQNDPKESDDEFEEVPEEENPNVEEPEEEEKE